MSETSLTLFIDLRPGTKIDLRAAARAALAWADMVEEVGRHFDPLSSTIIELKSDLPPGCPSFITRVFGFDSRQFRVRQARPVRCLQIAQTPDVLLRGFCFPAMNAA